MAAPAVEGIDLFKITGRSISGWIKSLKTGTASHVWQPFCSQLEERLLLWLEYNPQVVRCARGDPTPSVVFRHARIIAQLVLRRTNRSVGARTADSSS